MFGEKSGHYVVLRSLFLSNKWGLRKLREKPESLVKGLAEKLKAKIYMPVQGY